MNYQVGDTVRVRVDLNRSIWKGIVDSMIDRAGEEATIVEAHERVEGAFHIKFRDEFFPNALWWSEECFEPIDLPIPISEEEFLSIFD